MCASVFATDSNSEEESPLCLVLGLMEMFKADTQDEEFNRFSIFKYNHYHHH